MFPGPRNTDFTKKMFDARDIKTQIFDERDITEVWQGHPQSVVVLMLLFWAWHPSKVKQRSMEG